MNGHLARPLAARLNGLSALPLLPDNAAPVPAHVIDAAKAALDRGETHYTDRAGVPVLRALVAARIEKQCGVQIDPKAITITCGLAEARSVAVRVLTKPGTAILCPQGFAEVAGVAHLIGAEMITQLDQPVSLAYLTPADPPEIMQAAIASGAAIVWDLTHSGPAAHPALDPAIAPRVTTIDSLDAQFPGWRIGWLAGSEMADRLRGFKQSLTICTTSVSQWAAVEWLQKQ